MGIIFIGVLFVIILTIEHDRKLEKEGKSIGDPTWVKIMLFLTLVNFMLPFYLM